MESHALVITLHIRHMGPLSSVAIPILSKRNILIGDISLPSKNVFNKQNGSLRIISGNARFTTFGIDREFPTESLPGDIERD